MRIAPRKSVYSPERAAYCWQGSAAEQTRQQGIVKHCRAAESAALLHMRLSGEGSDREFRVFRALERHMHTLLDVLSADGVWSTTAASASAVSDLQ